MVIVKANRFAKGEIQNFPWGKIVWKVSGKLGNSESMTFGRVTIHAGQSNSKHSHPNCDEVLHLISGRLEHSVGDEIFLMKRGDTLSIPRGIIHNAKAIGKKDPVMVVAYSSAYRETTQE